MGPLPDLTRLLYVLMYLIPAPPPKKKMPTLTNLEFCSYLFVSFSPVSNIFVVVRLFVFVAINIKKSKPKAISVHCQMQKTSEANAANRRKRFPRIARHPFEMRKRALRAGATVPRVQSWALSALQLAHQTRVGPIKLIIVDTETYNWSWHGVMCSVQPFSRWCAYF